MPDFSFDISHLSFYSGQPALVLAGNPREAIDGVRHFMNRAEHGGVAAARLLMRAGAQVDLILPAHHRPPEDFSCIQALPDGRGIASAADMLEACAALSGRNYAAVLQLAAPSSLVAAEASPHKLKIKQAEGAGITLEAKGNAGLLEELFAMFPRAALAGYNTAQAYRENETAARTALRALCEEAARTAPETARRYTLTPPPPGGALAGRRIVVTTGPTVERLTISGDAISNFSSGRQGVQVAEALIALGAEVVLVCGPVEIPLPQSLNLRLIAVESTRKMYDACLAALPADGFIGVAAVADFGAETPEAPLSESERRTLRLVQQPDILRSVGTHLSLRPSVVVGFAAETRDAAAYARGKLAAKGADFICANLVSDAMVEGGAGNTVTFVSQDGAEGLPPMSKREVGARISARVAALLGA